MARLYSASFVNVAVTTATDLFEINAPSDGCVVLYGFCLGQTSDAGDAQSENLLVKVHRGSTSGSAGTTPTATPMSVGDTAFGGTVEVNNTTQATEGTLIHAEPFNVIAGLNVWWQPELRPVISPSGRIVIELDGAPADSLTMSGTVYFEEIAG